MKVTRPRGLVRLLRLSSPQLVVTLLIIGMPGAGVSQGFTWLPPEAPLARVIDPLIEPLLAGDGAAAEVYLREHAAPDMELGALLEQLQEVSRRRVSTPTARVAAHRASIGSDTSRVLVELTRGAPPIMVVIATTGDRPRIAGIRAVTLSSMRNQVTAEQRREILDSLYLAVERHYVAPDTALMIADHLRALDRAGVYDVLYNVHAMTVDLTHDLQALNRDLHLSVGWRAPQTAAAESAPEESPGGLPDFLRMEWLSEGIGYLEIEFSRMDRKRERLSSPRCGSSRTRTCSSWTCVATGAVTPLMPSSSPPIFCRPAPISRAIIGGRPGRLGPYTRMRRFRGRVAWMCRCTF